MQAKEEFVAHFPITRPNLTPLSTMYAFRRIVLSTTRSNAT